MSPQPFDKGLCKALFSLEMWPAADRSNREAPKENQLHLLRQQDALRAVDQLE